MIEIAGKSIDLNDPVTLAVLGAGSLVVLILVLLIMAVRAAGKSARMSEPRKHTFLVFR